MAETDNPYQDKIDKDAWNKKNLIQLKAGTANQQLMNAAYLGARQEPPAVTTWMNAAESGLTSFTEAIDKSKKARQAEVDKMNGDIDTQIDTLTTAGFSLGETYYGAANEYTKGLREKYLAAEGDPEAQNKIKMELNVASQNIGTTKQAIEDIATAWGVDDDESTLERSALNQSQRDIIKTVTNDANAVWDYEENTFVWKNPENGETYTAKDIDDIQKIASRDYVGKEDYIKYEQTKAENGMLFHEDGTGEAFNPTKETFANLKRINDKNINFYINGDFTGDGTPSFKDELPNHPDFKWDAVDNPIFDALSKITLPNGEPMYPDLDGDPDMDIYDLEHLDPTDDGDFTDADKTAAMEKVYNAITDPTAKGYDFEATKSLIAEYMTLRQKQKFYGDKDLDLKPDAYDSDEEFKAAGGSMGYAKSQGWDYVEKKYKTGRGTKAKMVSYVPKQEHWVQKKIQGGSGGGNKKLDN